MTPRRFPGPWPVEASDGAFIVKDANGFAITYVCWKPQIVTKAEAIMIAEAVAKLPELLDKPK